VRLAAGYFLVAIENASSGAIHSDDSQIKKAFLVEPAVGDLLTVGGDCGIYGILPRLKPRTFVREVTVLPGLEIPDGEVAGAPVGISEEPPVGRNGTQEVHEVSHFVCLRDWFDGLLTHDG
jgi:hypothetical protein